jgi:hypothetical protein
MNDIKQIKWTMYHDGQRDMSSISIERGDDAKGLKSVWFFLSREELHSLAYGTASCIEDGHHRLSLMSRDHCVFYDFCIPNKGAGVMEVPYFTANLPRVFWKFLFKMSCYVWKQSRAAEKEVLANKGYWSSNRLEVSIPLETLARFQSRYGQGLGKIDRQYSQRLLLELGTRPEKVDSNHYRSLKECVEKVERIARNSTRSVYQTVRCSIQNDMDGYFFSVPNLHGGIVNHAARENGNDWSIHT